MTTSVENQNSEKQYPEISLMGPSSKYAEGHESPDCKVVSLKSIFDAILILKDCQRELSYDKVKRAYVTHKSGKSNIDYHISVVKAFLTGVCA